MQSWEFDRIAIDARGDAAPGARGRRPARCGCAAGVRVWHVYAAGGTVSSPPPLAACEEATELVESLQQPAPGEAAPTVADQPHQP